MMILRRERGEWATIVVMDSTVSEEGGGRLELYKILYK